MVPKQVETDDVVESSIAQIRKEWRKSTKNHDEMKKLMARTYEKRRSMVKRNTTYRQCHQRFSPTLKSSICKYKIENAFFSK